MMRTFVKMMATPMMKMIPACVKVSRMNGISSAWHTEDDHRTTTICGSMIVNITILRRVVMLRTEVEHGQRTQRPGAILDSCW